MRPEHRLRSIFDGLKREIELMPDSEDKQIAKAMAVLAAAVEVGPKTDRLSARTGFATEFLDSISKNMRKAGLWGDNWVDDREWGDTKRGMEGLFAQALVALGEMKRETTLTGARYIEASTGNIVREWRRQ